MPPKGKGKKERERGGKGTRNDTRKILKNQKDWTWTR